MRLLTPAPAFSRGGSTESSAFSDLSRCVPLIDAGSMWCTWPRSAPHSFANRHTHRIRLGWGFVEHTPGLIANSEEESQLSRERLALTPPSSTRCMFFFI